VDRLGQPTSVHNSEGGTCFKNTVRLVFYGFLRRTPEFCSFGLFCWSFWGDALGGSFEAAKRVGIGGLEARTWVECAYSAG
jgi:hypothetical protein